MGERSPIEGPLNPVPYIAAFVGFGIAISIGLFTVLATDIAAKYHVRAFGERFSWRWPLGISAIEWFAVSLIFMAALGLAGKADLYLLTSLTYRVAQWLFWIVPVGSIVVFTVALVYSRYHSGVHTFYNVLGIIALLIAGLGFAIAIIDWLIRNVAIFLAWSGRKRVRILELRLATADLLNSFWFSLGSPVSVPEVKASEPTASGIDELLSSPLPSPPWSMDGIFSHMGDRRIWEPLSPYSHGPSHENTRSGTNSIRLMLSSEKRETTFSCTVTGNGFTDEAEKYSKWGAISFVWPDDFPNAGPRPQGIYEVTWRTSNDVVATDRFTKRKPVAAPLAHIK